MGCSSVGRQSDRHAADADSIPQCGKGFSSQSQLSVQTLSVSVHPGVQSYALTHVKDPVVHVRARWIMETQTYQVRTIATK